MKLNSKRLISIISVGLLGAAAGYAYYYFIGCANGTCAITSNPVNSSLYGSLMGGLLGDSIHDIVSKQKNKKETL